MSVRATVLSQFEQVAKEQERRLARLSDELRLLDSGLDSLLSLIHISFSCSFTAKR